MDVNIKYIQYVHGALCAEMVHWHQAISGSNGQRELLRVSQSSSTICNSNDVDLIYIIMGTSPYFTNKI